MSRIVKGSNILPYLQAKTLIHHKFVHVSVRIETPGSKAKDFITHSNSSSQSMSICPGSPSPRSQSMTHKGPADTCT